MQKEGSARVLGDTGLHQQRSSGPVLWRLWLGGWEAGRLKVGRGADERFSQESFMVEGWQRSTALIGLAGRVGQVHRGKALTLRGPGRDHSTS